MAKPSPEVLELIAERFRILGEPARLHILTELLDGERTVTQLVEATGLGQANVSKHLQQLRAGRFVARRREGSFAYYRVADPSVPHLCDIMCAEIGEDAQTTVALLATGPHG